MPGPDCRLDSDWDPDAGRLTLTLVNRGRDTLAGFRLAFTALFRISGPPAGGRLVDQLSNYHVLAPPDGFVLPPGGTWTVTADGVSHDLRHYTYGPKTAWLELADGRAEPVAPTVMSRGGVAVDPSPSPAPRAPLPADAPPLAVIPHPARVAVEGARPLPAALVFAGGPPEARAAFDAAAALAARLLPGLPLFGAGGLPCRAAADPALPPEAYRLDFDAAGVRVAAAGAAGFTYGWITLAQVLHGARTQPATFVVPAAGTIEDGPRFAFRGAHLDVARQFYPMEEVEAFVDTLAWNRLNVLHLHLSDDEGWRLAVPGYPALAEVAAWRGRGLAVPPLLGSGIARYGGTYTPAEIGGLVAHAARLGITVVPEIDVPGHCHCVLAALPVLRDPGETGAYRSIQGFPNNALNPAMAETYRFLEAVLGEVARLFPAPWVHVGGDEVADDAWLGSPHARALMAAEGWTGSGELQSHFLRRVQAILAALGRKTAAWEEAALGGGIAPEGAYLVAWRHADSARALAGAGYDVVLAPAQHAYLDMAQRDDFAEPGASWAGTVPLSAAYGLDPGADWPDALRPRLVGVQSCLWSENLDRKRLFDHLVYPRLSALAETAWTPPGRKSWPRFLATHSLMPASGIGGAGG